MCHRHTANTADNNKKYCVADANAIITETKTKIDHLTRTHLIAQKYNIQYDNIIIVIIIQVIHEVHDIQTIRWKNKIQNQNNKKLTLCDQSKMQDMGAL